MNAENEEITLDVRPLIASGDDPFGAIMSAKGKLLEGQRFHLIAPFQPTPLYSFFEADGYRARAEQSGPEEWHIYFEMVSEDGGDTDETVKQLDLRYLLPPEPLQKGLEAIGQLGRGEMLLLHTRFRPVHLIEQLNMDVFDFDCEEAEANHWKTHIWRQSPINE